MGAMGARFAENGFFYIHATFTLAYATQALGMPRQAILNGVLIAAAIETFTIPAFGALSDVVGRRPVYIFGAHRARPGRGARRHVRPAGKLPVRVVRYQGALQRRIAGLQPRLDFRGRAIAPDRHLADDRVQAGDLPISVYMIILALITIVSVYFAAETRKTPDARSAPSDQLLGRAH
jgi:MFS transporter, MHS family, shikimate and dehydroshikimate transport protein